MLVTNDLQIPVINSRCAELLDLPPDFIKNPPRFDRLAEFQGAAKPDATTDIDLSVAPSPGQKQSPGQVAVSERKMPNGSVIEVRRGQLPDGSFVQTFTDITQRREAEAHVARLASEDPLTGLPNRRVFRATLDDLCRRHRHKWKGTDRVGFALLFLDVDRFKVINDTLGHRVGDMLLQEVAKRLEASLPASDILARLGGDEFAVIVPAITVAGRSRSAGEEDRRCGRAAVRDRRISDPLQRQHRHCRRTARRRRRRRIADGCRPCALCGQGRRPRRLQVLQPRDELGSERPARARNEPSRRDRAQRARAALSAAHRPQPQRHHRL